MGPHNRLRSTVRSVPVVGIVVVNLPTVFCRGPVIVFCVGMLYTIEKVNTVGLHYRLLKTVLLNPRS